MTTETPNDQASLPEQRRAQLARLLKEKARQSRVALPASPAQRGLWFMQQMDPASHAYHLVFCARILSPFDPGIAKTALRALIDRHSMLRTTFRSDSHRLEMLVQGAGEIDFVEVGAAGWSEEELRERAGHALRQPFDLQNGPLMRAHLFSRSGTDHVFLLVLHHLACDGPSLPLLLAEFIEYYQAPGAARPRTGKIDFPEFVRQQRHRLAGPAGEAGKAFWLDRLAGEIPQLDLPVKRAFQESNPVSSAVHSFEIDQALCWQLTALARSCGVTTFSLLFSAYQTLLMRLSGQHDILVGVPMSGRNQPGYESIVGHLINLVAIRCDLRGDPPFRALVAQTWRELRGAIEHQEFPFSELVKLVRPAARFERYPLFRTCFNIVKPGPGDPMLCMLWKGAQGSQWGPLRIAPFPIETLDEQYDLSVRVVEIEGRMQVGLQYNSMLFDAAWIAHFSRCLISLFQSIVSDPDCPLSRLSLMDAADRERILVSWNATSAEYPRDATVHQLFERQAARTPDAVALVFSGTQISYRELNARANQLARYLVSRGVGRDDLVAVCAERSTELVVGLLATLKAGAAYVPVDPRYPADRVRQMLQDCRASMVLATSGSDEIIGPGDGAHRFYMDRERARLAAFPPEDLPVINDPLDLAYVIYTSGSTGQPRGVQIPHRALVNFLCSMRGRPGLAESDVLLSVTTFSFDIFGLELFLPLMVGARMELAGADEIVDGQLLAERLAACGATVMQATPVTWRMLLGAGFRPAGPFKALCGGEALPADLARDLLAAGFELWNMYGPTETTVWSCVERVHDADHGAISIGRPIANTQAYVLDSNFQPVPLGVVGELYLGGDGLARGYLRHPELTAERFIPSPFSSDPAQRIYRTGDLACFLPDGRIECAKRTDHQVKIRGFRIEIEEIEVNLRRQENVRAAAVVAQEGPNGVKRLIAFVTGDFPHETWGDLFRQGLRKTLPDYMIPAQFILLPELPLTPNGKLDRKSLPLPAWGETSTSKYVAPADDLQQELADIFSEVLKAPRVGATDTFFDLGGDSLSAITLAARIKARFDRTITLAALFHAPTVADLANLLRDDMNLDNLTLMTLRRSETGIPLFFLPGADGSGLRFQTVVEQMPAGRSVYAYNVPHTEEHSSARDTIHAYALDVLQRIREVHPRGPFHLLGYSFGGYVAFEIAHILAEKGESPAFLGMIDSWGPGFPGRNAPWTRAMLHLKDIWNLDPRARIEYFQKRLPKVGKRAAQKLGRFKPAPAPQAPAEPTPQQVFDARQEVARLMLVKYRPKPLDHRLWFYRADIPYDTGPGLNFADPYNGWRKLIRSEFEITGLPCPHYKIFEVPAVTQLALALVDHLNQADSEIGSQMSRNS